MEAAVEAKRTIEIAVLDSSGDTKTIWNADDENEVEIARQTFKSLKDRGFAIFRVDKKGEKGEKMNSFDPSAEKMIAVPRIAGG